jgi:hypothetical protein
MDNDTIVHAPQCPRCGGFIPSNQRPGEYMGALSRADNHTYVCSACGTEEAMIQFSRDGFVYPPDTWPLTQHPHHPVGQCSERHDEAEAIVQTGKVRFA